MSIQSGPNTNGDGDGSLSARLRDETADVHDAAERSAFMTKLMDGALGVEAYVRLLAQYRVIYARLEAAAEVMRRDPVAVGFAARELERASAIDADLIAIAGRQWPESVEVTPAATAYADHIDATCFDWPGGFVAHHYVRYLGDLSGGQFIRRVLRRHFGLADDRGLSFYVFDAIGNGVQFKNAYRDRLDAAPWDEPERDRIVAEARRAFELNIDLFRSLETAPATASGTSR
jgi:heme oxygenase